MASEPEGRIVVPIWSDGGVARPLVNDDGRVPVKIEETTAEQDVNITGCDITVPVSTVATGSSVQGQVYGWDLSNWRKLPILWGFMDRLVDNFDTTIGGANVNIYSSAVPTGYIWIIQCISVRNASAGPTNYTMFMRANGSQASFFHDEQGLAQWRAAIYNGEFVLKAADDIGVNVVGGAAGNNIQARLWGYTMKVNE